MKIDYSNKNIIDEDINIHDSIFTGFVYESENNKLMIEMSNYCLEKKVALCFYNVLIVNCEMCQFWGKSFNILDWNLSSEEKLIKTIMQKQTENEEAYKFSLLSNNKKYIETIITLTSGDIINIVCEYIEMEESRLDKNII